MEWTPFSYPFNLTQQPAASVPCGFTREGLPVGLQVVAGRFADEQVLRVQGIRAALPSRHLQGARCGLSAGIHAFARRV
jgi:aspartyl-tRNA(Asn)/glutamyl-tRNA(Gln) amidotransferase subunit A